MWVVGKAGLNEFFAPREGFGAQNVGQVVCSTEGQLQLHWDGDLQRVRVHPVTVTEGV